MNINAKKVLSKERSVMIAGKKCTVKKGVALTLALLTLGGCFPYIPAGLDFSPKANALFSKQNFRIQRPFEIPEVIEFLRNDPYYRVKLQMSGAIVSDPSEFKKWWGEFGERWWHSTPQGGEMHGGESNIVGNHAPEEAEQGFAQILLGGLSKSSKSGAGGKAAEPVRMDEELSAVDRLLLCFLTATLHINGDNEMGLSGSVVNLIKDAGFKKIVDDNFGMYIVNDQKTSVMGMPIGKPHLIQVRGHDRLISLAIDRGSNIKNLDRGLMSSRLQRNAYPLMLASFAFFGTSSVAKTKDILASVCGWSKFAVVKAYNRFVYNRLKLERDPVKLKELMGEYLKSGVFRQDEAMDRIVEIMSGMADLWAESERTGVPCTSACTMIFMGDSGVGKTYAARMLSQAIFHKDMQPWQFITSTAITVSATSTGKNNDGSSKSAEKLSPADQLFNENSELVRQLRLNNRVILVIDEIDKMHEIDEKDTVLERLRDGRDTGKLLVRMSNGNYNYVDISRTVLIGITNEHRECWGLPKANLTEAQAASRTTVKRDRSLTNRFDVVEFKNFTSDDYECILKPQLDDLKKEYAENHKMDLNISDELVKSIAHAAEVKNKGVRGVNDYMVLLRGKLVGYRSVNKNKLDKKTGNEKINIKYVPDDNTFEVK